MFEVGLIMIGAAFVLTVIAILAGLFLAVFKDEDLGAVVGLGGGILFWGLYVAGIGVTIIGAVFKWLI